MASRGGRVRFYFEGESSDLVRETRTAENALKRLGTQQGRTSTTMRSASTRTTELDKHTRSLAGSLMGAAKYAAGAAAAYLSISQAKAAVTTTQDLAKATMGLHGNLGLSNRAAGEWAAAARSRGVDTTKLGMAFKTLSTQVEAARNGSASAKEMFKSLGISMADLDKGSKNIPFLMSQIADGTDKAGAGTERLSTISKLFGRSYAGIAPMIRDGSKALQENLQATEKYGSALHGKTLKDQEKLRSSLIESKQAWQGIQVQFTSAITPALTEANDQFQHLARILGNNKLSDAEKFHKIGDTISGWAGDAIHAFEDVLPQIAEKAGEEAPKVASALVHGFIDAPVLGKLALGAWFIKRLGGLGLIRSFGGRLAGALFGGMGGSSTGGALGKLSAPGSSPARPAYVAVVNGGIPGTGGGPTPVPSEGGPSKLSRLLRGLGYATILGSIVIPLADFANVPVDPRHVRDLRRSGYDGSQRYSSLGSGDPGLKSINHEADEATKSVKKLADALSGLHRDLNAHGIGFGKAVADDGDLSKREIGKILDSLGDLPKGARKQASAAMVGMAAELEDKGRLPKGSADKLRDQVLSTFHGMNLKSVDELEKLARGGDTQFKKLIGSSKRLDSGVSASIDSLASNVAAGFGQIGQNANSILQSFGVQQLTFDLAGAIGKGVDHKARGGLLPGYSAVDNVPAMLRSGEAVLTPEVHQPVVETALQATYGMGLRDLFQRTGAAYKSGGYVQHLAKGGKAGGTSAMTALANRFDAASEPYLLGGGHGAFLTSPAPVDCSGAVSAVLHAGGLLEGAPMDTVGLASWGKSASGNEPLVVATRPISGAGGHTVMKINGRVFGTSSENPNGGAGWLSNSNPRAYVSGAVLRTMDIGPGVSAQIKRVILNGPDGPLKSLGQAALDKVRGAASKYVQSHMPQGTGGPGNGGEGGAYSGPLNRIFPHWTTLANPGAQLSYTQAKTLANKARLPDVFPRLVSVRESGRHPGIAGTDPGGTRGLGLYMITTGYNDALIRRFGGEDAMANPWINSQAAKVLYDQSGMQPWDASGPYKRGGFVSRRMGGVVGRLRRFRGGGKVKEHYTPTGPPTKPPGGATTTLPGGSPVLGDLSPEEQIALLQIQLTAAEATPGTEDDAAILTQIETLQLGLLTGYQHDYDNLSLTGTEKKGLRKQARAKTAHLEDKLRKLTPEERKKLNEQAAGIQKKLDADLSPKQRKALEAKLKDKHTSKKEREQIQKQLDADLTPEQKAQLKDRLQHVDKLQRKGILTADERKQLRAERGGVYDRLTTKALETKRSDLIGKIGTATDDLAATRDQTKALKDNTEGQDALAEAIKANADAQKALADEIAKQNALIANATTSDLTQALAFVGDLLSGAVGGLVAPRLQTAGAGSVTRS